MLSQTLVCKCDTLRYELIAWFDWFVFSHFSYFFHRQEFPAAERSHETNHRRRQGAWEAWSVLPQSTNNTDYSYTLFPQTLLKHLLYEKKHCPHECVVSTTTHTVYIHCKHMCPFNAIRPVAYSTMCLVSVYREAVVCEEEQEEEEEAAVQYSQDWWYNLFACFCLCDSHKCH